MLPPAHALCLGDTPKYGPDFTRFAYTNPHAPKGGILRRYALGGFNNFNPFTPKGRPSAAFYLTDDSLAVQSLDEPYTFYGLIAQKMELAKDRSKIIFHIHPQAKFHDHTPITADDVVFSYNALKKNIGSAFRQFFRHVTQVRALDPTRVEFCFAPDAPRQLPLIVAGLQVFPKHYWQKQDLSRTTLDIPVGSGPYQIQSFQLGRNIVYQRVKDYWAKDLPVCRFQYNFDQIRYEYFRDETVAMEAFKAGLYDIRVEVPPRHRNQLEQIKGIRILERDHQRPLGIEGFFFNTRRYPFEDAKVRKALLLAFDWEWTNTHLLSGQRQRCNSFFTNSDLSAAGLSEAKTPALPVSDGTGYNRKNLLAADRLLVAAGWKIKNGQRVDSKNQPLVFRLLTDSSTQQRLATPWVYHLKKLGIQASIHLVDSAQFVHRFRHYNYDMIASGYGQNLWPGQEVILNWHSRFAEPGSGGRNFIGLKDPTIDRLAETLTKAQNRRELIAAGQALDQLLMAGNYVIPLGVSSTYLLAARKTIGIPDKAPGYDLGDSCWWYEPEKDKAR